MIAEAGIGGLDAMIVEMQETERNVLSILSLTEQRNLAKTLDKLYYRSATKAKSVAL